MDKIKTFLNYKWLPYLIGIVSVVAYSLPFVLFGDSSYVRILDCLDNEIGHYQMIVDNHALLDHSKVLPIMYGIPRQDFVMIFSIKWLFFAFLPAFWAFVLNDFVVRLLGFLGMYWLLTEYMLDKDRNSSRWIALFVSILFAYVSYYTIYGLSVAGVPLLLYAFLNIRDGKLLWLSYLLILLFSFYSHLELVGVFAGLLLGCYYIYLAVTRKSWCWPFFWGLIFLGAGYAVSCFDILYSFLAPSDIISHRVEFRQHENMSIVISTVKDLVLKGQFHRGLFKTKWIILTILIGCICQWRGFNKKLISSSLLVVVLIVMTACAWYLKAFSSVGIFQSFHFERFDFLLPAAWFIAYVCALSQIGKYLREWIPFLLILLMVPAIYNGNPELKTSVRRLQGKIGETPTYRQHFDVDLFNAIAANLPVDRRNCKVVSLGMYPDVAQYNGFYTLDGYVDIYSLEYKHQFREVIADELSKNESLRVYFDDWGNRCYLFSAELGREYIFDKNSEVRVQHLDINVDALRSLGCQYIFAAVPVDNYEELGLTIFGEYETADSYRRIIVYRVQ